MRGEVVYQYAFDVANEIKTAKIKDIQSEKPFPFEIRTERTLPRDVPIYRPLTIEPTISGISIGKAPVRVIVRIYDVGVVNITLRIPFAVESLIDLLPYHSVKLDDGRSLDTFAKSYCRDVCKSIESTITKPSKPHEPEAYTIFCWSDRDSKEQAEVWLQNNRRDVAGLLTETAPYNLSESQTLETVRINRSFEQSDLVVIDWDAALVIDSTGYVDDVLYVLELANLQLEEFKVIDMQLDKYLDEAYDVLGNRPRLPVLGMPTGMIRVIRRVRVDVAKLADEVTHITKFVGDWYLARVYLGARDRFHLDQWRKSVEDRLAQLDSLYGVVYSELNERRMLWLEIIIVILFLADLGAVFLQMK